MKTDIQIAQEAKIVNILEIAKKVGLTEDDIEQYGKYKAKFSSNLYKKIEKRKNGKLILVTAISPTPLGEGKTTMAIAIADGLQKFNISIKRTIIRSSIWNKRWSNRWRKSANSSNG